MDPLGGPEEAAAEARQEAEAKAAEASTQTDERPLVDEAGRLAKRLGVRPVDEDKSYLVTINSGGETYSVVEIFEAVLDRLSI